MELQYASLFTHITSLPHQSHIWYHSIFTGEYLLESKAVRFWLYQCDDMLVSGFIALNFICWSINKQMTHHNEVLCLSE